MAKVQFDRGDVIENATKLFWDSGFNGTSMQEVFAVTGLKPGSIYLAFGNKEGLFRETLDSYAFNNLNDIKRTLDSTESVSHGICKILRHMVNESSQSDYCSCFLVKSQLELASEHPELHALVVRHLQEVEDLYRDYLLSECDKGTAMIRARSIMMHIFGLRVYGYLNSSPKKMLDGVKAGLPWLPW